MKASILVWSVLQSRYRFFETSASLTLLVDFLINVCCTLAATTIYADLPILLLAFLVVPAASLYLTSQTPSLSKIQKPKTSARSSNEATSGFSDFPIRPFLTGYRGSMMVITNLCILAVDFHAFPRRFAKVETWGTSLMDVGVGSFVFSAGLVSAKSALKTRMALAERAVVASKKGKAVDNASAKVKEQAQGDPTARKQVALIFRLANALRAAMPVLILGFARLWSVKAVDYAEHVSEYGVHWNFFFTTGLLPIAMALADPILSALPAQVPSYALLGIAIMSVQGIALESRATGLQAWALSAPRTNLLSQNREGVISFVGYLAIFLLGMEAGTVVLPREPIAGLGALITPKASTSPKTHRRNTLMLLATSGLLYAAASYFLVESGSMVGLPKLVTGISRRLANPPYVLWIAAFNYLQLFVSAAIETVLFPGAHAAKTPEEERKEAQRATSAVLDAFNGGGLAIFLLANLGTGLVNLTVNTLERTTLEAVAILVTYMALLTVAALGLQRNGLKLKL